MIQTVFMLHGTAERDPNYAGAFVANLKKHLGSIDVNIVQGFYGDLLQPAEDVLNAKLESESTWRNEHEKSIRTAVNQFLLDMTQTIVSSNMWTDIYNRIHEQLPVYTAGRGAIHLVLHS